MMHQEQQQLYTFSIILISGTSQFQWDNGVDLVDCQRNLLSQMSNVTMTYEGCVKREQSSIK
jgi:hypothetical protein